MDEIKNFLVAEFVGDGKFWVFLNKIIRLKIGLHDAICPTDSFLFMQGHCVNFKAMRCESTTFNSSNRMR